MESWGTLSCNAATNKCSGFDSVNNKLTEDGTLFKIPLRMTANVTNATITLTGEGLNNGFIPISPATPSFTITTSTAPQANNDSYTVAEGGTLTINAASGVLANDTDADPLTATLGTTTTNGTLNFSSDGSFTYTHDGGETTSDSFTYTASDGTETSGVATATITVTPVNDAPTADDKTASTNEDLAVAITLSGSDVDDDDNTLSFALATGPSNGSLAISGATATYTPTTGFSGTDSFTYTASDGNATSAPATVTITVVANNAAPVAQNIAAQTAEDAPVTVTLSATDGDSDPLTYAIASQPANGTLSVTGASATYTPAANYNGTDTFTYTANDGTVNSNAATVTITITAVNDAPSAQAVAVTTVEGQGVAFNLVGTDPDGDTLSYTVTTQPSNGTVIQTGASASYLPNANYFGTDTFEYTVSDGTLTSAAATVTVTITGTNDAPVAQDGAATTAEDAPAEITLGATDADNDALTFAVGTPSNGTVTVSGATATYTPAANFNGTDSFTFTASDGVETSNTATITLTVTPVNDAPTADAKTLTVAEDASGTVTLTGADVDGDNLTFAIATQATNGTATVDGSTATYTPNADFVGQDTFTYTANDGTADSQPATVTVTITPVNDAPIASDVTAAGEEDTAIEVTLSATDGDGDAVTFAVTDDPSNGSISLSGSVVTYTPNADFNGSDSFMFTASDGQATSEKATATITVQPVNDAPTAVSALAETTSDAAVEITLAGNDVDGDDLTFAISTAPFSGTASLDGNVVTYKANDGYVGTDAFAFTVSDGTATSAPAAVTIQILPARTFTIQIIHGGGSGLPDVMDVYYGTQLVASGLAAGTATAYIEQSLGAGDLVLAASPSTGPASGFTSFTPPWGQGDTATAVFASVGSNQANAQMIEYPSSAAASSSSSVDGTLVHASSRSAAVDVATISTDVDHTPLVFLASGLTFGSVSSTFAQAAESHVYRVESGGGQVVGEYQLDLSAAAGEGISLVLLDDAVSGSILLKGFRPNGSAMNGGIVTNTEEDGSLPGKFVLKGNYPNPFNPTTTISFDLPETSDVQVDVLDLLGRTMISVPLQSMSAGANRSISIDAADLTSGIYMYRVLARGVSNTWVKSGTMTLIK